jgi:hypothetical protein
MAALGISTVWAPLVAPPLVLFSGMPSRGRSRASRVDQPGYQFDDIGSRERAALK